QHYYQPHWANQIWADHCWADSGLPEGPQHTAKQEVYAWLPLRCPVLAAGFGSCSVCPCNKSTTCGIRVATAFSESTAPWGDPGRFTISVPFRVNPPPRESGAN